VMFVQLVNSMIMLVLIVKNVVNIIINVLNVPLMNVNFVTLTDIYHTVNVMLDMLNF